MPLLAAGVTANPEPKSDAQLRREAAKADLEAENAAEAGGFGTDGANDDAEPRLSGTTARGSEETARGSEDTGLEEEGLAAQHTAEVEA